jgi:5-methylcytosine-specific restriction endonuclease McrA
MTIRPNYTRFQAANGRPCPYCAETMVIGDVESPHQPTRDHILPRSRGGSHKQNNGLIVCRACNVAKDNRTLVEWHAQLVRYSDPRAMFVWAVIEARDIAGFTLYEPEKKRRVR